MSKVESQRATPPQATNEDVSEAQLRCAASNDLSLLALVPKWSGADPAVPLTRFFATIEGSARIGNWKDADKVQLCSLKLTGEAAEFFWSTPELCDSTSTWEELKTIFLTRFRDVRPPQYHYDQLHVARQRKDETPRQFLDRVRVLASRTVPCVADPTLLQAHKEAAKSRLFTSYKQGLIGEHGKQVRLLRPNTVEEALDIAENTIQTLLQESRQHAFYTGNEPIDITAAGRVQDPNSQFSGACSSRANKRGGRNRKPQAPPKQHEPGSAQSVTVQYCAACGGQGHLSRVCANTLQAAATNTQSGRKGGNSRNKPTPPHARPQQATSSQGKRPQEN
jgi:hypothetical protein